MIIAHKITLASENMNDNLHRAGKKIKPIRLIHSLDKLAIAAVGGLLDEAKIHYPVGNSQISLYLGFQDAIEDIKENYFRNILKDGIWGASPLMFPFTSPNSLAAQISIAFDLRGEILTFCSKEPEKEILLNAVNCLVFGDVSTIIAGVIQSNGETTKSKEKSYLATFYLLTDAEQKGITGKTINLDDLDNWIHNFISSNPP